MSEYILALENISKRFGSVIALQNVTLRLKPGEVHCLLGDNGAGKSTLIKTLAGVHRPTSGQYLVDGQSVSFNSPKEALDLGVATVYQDLALVPLLSVARNFFMGREPIKKMFGVLPVMDMEYAATTARDKLAEMGGRMLVQALALSDEGRLQRRFDAGYLGEVDIALDLLVFGRFKVELLNPVALQYRHPCFFRVARIDKHARCH